MTSVAPCSARAVMAGVLAGILVISARVGAQEVSYSGSFSFATGDYIFTERTSSLYVFNGVDVVAGRARLFANIPFISQSTPWVSYGTVPIPSGGGENAIVHAQTRGRRARDPVVLPTEGVSSETGVGDPMFRGDFELLEEQGQRPSVRLGGSVKFPVADVERGLGTGEWDYGAVASIAKAFGRSSLVVDVSYWFFGDMPDLDLQNGVGYSVSYGRIVGDGSWAVLASLSGFTTIIENTDPPLQVGAGVSYLLSYGRSLMVSTTLGLSEGSPDFGIWFGWRIGLGRQY